MGETESITCADAPHSQQRIQDNQAQFAKVGLCRFWEVLYTMPNSIRASESSQSTWYFPYPHPYTSYISAHSFHVGCSGVQFKGKVRNILQR